MTREELIKLLIVERYSPRPKFDPDTADRQRQRRNEMSKAFGHGNDYDMAPELRIVKEAA